MVKKALILFGVMLLLVSSLGVFYNIENDDEIDNPYLDQNPENHPKGGLVYERNLTPIIKTGVGE